MTMRRSITAALLAAAALVGPARGASASFLSITSPSPTLSPGQSETVSVQFTSTESFLLQAIDLAIAYDKTRFSVSNVQLGNLDSAATGFSLAVGFPASGVAGIGEVTTSAFTGTLGNQINLGTIGTLETFTLTVLPAAPAGVGSIINLQASFGNTFTAVYADANGDAIGLTPPPTNGFDPGIDALITVTPVPEPSSIALLGLGGAGLLGYALRHRRTIAA